MARSKRRKRRTSRSGEAPSGARARTLPTPVLELFSTAGPLLARVDLEEFLRDDGSPTGYLFLSDQSIREGDVPPLVCHAWEEPATHTLHALEAAEKARIAGQKTIDILVLFARDLTDGIRQALHLELPLRRRPLFWQMRMLQAYLDRTGLDPSPELHESLGLTEEQLAPVLTLLFLDGEVQELLRDGALSDTAAVCIAGIEDEGDQRYLARTAIKNAWSLKRLQIEILDTCELACCRECTLELWNSIPSTNGPLPALVNHTEQPEDPAAPASNGGNR